MHSIKLMISVSIISSIAFSTSAACEKDADQSSNIQYPKLTKQFILKHQDKFPFPFQYTDLAIPDARRGELLNDLLKYINEDTDDNFFKNTKDELQIIVNRDILQLPHKALAAISLPSFITLIKKLNIDEADLLTFYSQSVDINPQFFLSLISNIYDNNDTARLK